MNNPWLTLTLINYLCGKDDNNIKNYQKAIEAALAAVGHQLA